MNEPNESEMSFHNRRAVEAADEVLAEIDALLASHRAEEANPFRGCVAKALSRLVECLQDEDKKGEKEES